GFIATETRRADNTLKSEGTTAFDADGNPSLSQTTSYAKNGTTVKETSQTSFAAAVFDDESNIVGGHIATETRRADNTLKSEGTTDFSTDGNPTLSQTTTYAKNGTTVKEKTQTSFAAAIFDDESNIVGGSIATETHRADDTLKSQGTTVFSAVGN